MIAMEVVARGALIERGLDVSGVTGISQYVEITENHDFREEMRIALLSGAIPLGIMPFRYEDRRLLYGRLHLPWVEKTRWLRRHSRQSATRPRRRSTWRLCPGTEFSSLIRRDGPVTQLSGTRGTLNATCRLILFDISVQLKVHIYVTPVSQLLTAERGKSA